MTPVENKLNDLSEDLADEEEKVISTEEEKNPYDDKEIIDEALDFIKDSGDYFGEDLDRAKDDFKFYSNSFWDDENKRIYKRTKRPCSETNEYKKIASAIVSSYSASPYHIQLLEAPEKIQNVIDMIESDSSSKISQQESIRNAAITGYGYCVITSVKDDYSDNYKWIIENIGDISRVAADPNAQKSTLEDSEAGALIDFLPISKAKRLYGKDIIEVDVKYKKPLVWDLRFILVNSR